MTYRVQKGKLTGGYKDVLNTESSDDAWVCYNAIYVNKGHKKRIQEISPHAGVKPKTLDKNNRYWTDGR